MNELQGLPGTLHADLWRVCIGRYLRCADLCALMQLSPEWFYFWVADASWALQRQRVCARFPDIASVFTVHEAPKDMVGRMRKSNSNKKRKTAWLMPRHGSWLVFKRYLSQCANAEQFKVVCRTEKLAALAVCALRIHVPHEERIGKWSVSHHGKGRSNREGWWHMHSIWMWSTDGYDRLEFRVLHGLGRVPCEHYQLSSGGGVTSIMHDATLVSFLYVVPAQAKHDDPWPFEPWHHFVLERPWKPRWTVEFEQRMRGPVVK